MELQSTSNPVQYRSLVQYSLEHCGTWLQPGAIQARQVPCARDSAFRHSSLSDGPGAEMTSEHCRRSGPSPGLELTSTNPHPTNGSGSPVAIRQHHNLLFLSNPNQTRRHRSRGQPWAVECGTVFAVQYGHRQRFFAKQLPEHTTTQQSRLAVRQQYPALQHTTPRSTWPKPAPYQYNVVYP
jgi:hypothetical protein